MTATKYTTHFLSVLAVCFFLFIAFGSDDDKKSESSSTTSSSSETTSSKPQTTEELKEQLKRELASFDKKFDNSSYNGTVESVQMELILFSVWASIVNKGLSSADNENQKLANDLKKKVIALQVKEFPRMRKAYGDVVSQKLWENDIYVSTQGGTNAIINFTGGLFAANKNIQETQTTLQKVLTEFRFKEARYRWYKGADEFTYYKIESPKDNELVTLE